MSLSVTIDKQLGDFHLALSFATNRGVLGLLGASGCGKSKTLQCITGIEKPDVGEIILHGRTLFSSQNHINVPVQDRRVGYLFQHYALFPDMTVAENIACGVRKKVSKRERQGIVNAMIDRLRLTGLARQKPNQLSGGQQQRVALARILVNDPDILLLDEPFSALDSYLKDQVMGELTTLIEDFQKDVIVVTHSRDEAYQLCDTIAVLDQGRLEVMGPTKEIFAQPQTKAAAVLMGCRNISVAEKRGPHEVYAKDWGIILQTESVVADTIQAVGIRDHALQCREPANRQPITVVECMEQPFAWLVQFRFTSQQTGTPALWQWISKSEYHGVPDAVGINPKDILLLYK